MNFYVVFNTVSTLTFVFEFAVNLENKQDFFYLEGQNQSALLSRTNDTIFLSIQHEENFALYSDTINQSTFEFSWKGFRINEKPMLIEKKEGRIHAFNYNNFLVLSPILNQIEECIVTKPEHFFHYDSVNYWYIVLIALAVGITIDSKEKSLKLIDTLRVVLSNRTKLVQVPEDDSLNTNV